jgi:hypothetical protein
MCCVLCEEPVRSIVLGLAAVGIVTAAVSQPGADSRATPADAVP